MSIDPNALKHPIGHLKHCVDMHYMHNPNVCKSIAEEIIPYVDRGIQGGVVGGGTGATLGTGGKIMGMITTNAAICWTGVLALIGVGVGLAYCKNEKDKLAKAFEEHQSLHERMLEIYETHFQNQIDWVELGLVDAVSLEPMKDPVILPCGHTFEKIDLEQRHGDDYKNGKLQRCIHKCGTLFDKYSLKWAVFKKAWMDTHMLGHISAYIYSDENRLDKNTTVEVAKLMEEMLPHLKRMADFYKDSWVRVAINKDIEKMSKFQAQELDAEINKIRDMLEIIRDHISRRDAYIEQHVGHEPQEEVQLEIEEEPMQQ